jgi:hypothetical protein
MTRYLRTMAFAAILALVGFVPAEGAAARPVFIDKSQDSNFPACRSFADIWASLLAEIVEKRGKVERRNQNLPWFIKISNPNDIDIEKTLKELRESGCTAADAIKTITEDNIKNFMDGSFVETVNKDDKDKTAPWRIVVKGDVKASPAKEDPPSFGKLEQKNGQDGAGAPANSPPPLPINSSTTEESLGVLRNWIGNDRWIIVEVPVFSLAAATAIIIITVSALFLYRSALVRRRRRLEVHDNENANRMALLEKTVASLPQAISDQVTLTVQTLVTDAVKPVRDVVEQQEPALSTTPQPPSPSPPLQIAPPADSSPDPLPADIAAEYRQVITNGEEREAILARWRPRVVEMRNIEQRYRSLSVTPILNIVDSPLSETYYWLIYGDRKLPLLVPSPSMHRARVRYLTPDGIVLAVLFDDIFECVEGLNFSLDIPATVTIEGDVVRVESCGRMIVPPRL